MCIAIIAGLWDGLRREGSGLGVAHTVYGNRDTIVI